MIVETNINYAGPVILLTILGMVWASQSALVFRLGATLLLLYLAVHVTVYGTYLATSPLLAFLLVFYMANVHILQIMFLYVTFLTCCTLLYYIPPEVMVSMMVIVLVFFYLAFLLLTVHPFVDSVGHAAFVMIVTLYWVFWLRSHPARLLR